MPRFSRIYTPHADAAPSLLPASRTPEFDSYFRPCIFPEKQNQPQPNGDDGPPWQSSPPSGAARPTGTVPFSGVAASPSSLQTAALAP